MGHSVRYYRNSIEFNRVMSETAAKLAEDLSHPAIKARAHGASKKFKKYQLTHEQLLEDLKEKIKNDRKEKSQMSNEKDQTNPDPVEETTDVAQAAAPTENVSHEGENPDAQPTDAGVGTPDSEKTEEDQA